MYLGARKAPKSIDKTRSACYNGVRGLGEGLAMLNASHQVRNKKVVEIREVRGGQKMAVCADMRSNGEK